MRILVRLVPPVAILALTGSHRPAGQRDSGGRCRNFRGCQRRVRSGERIGRCNHVTARTIGVAVRGVGVRRVDSETREAYRVVFALTAVHCAFPPVCLYHHADV